MEATVRFGKLAWLSVITFAVLSAHVALAQQYTISTVAGGAPPPTPMPAINASLGSTTSVATDSAGNVYFISLNCVFKIDTSGTLNRVAGTYKGGYSGDGGPAISALLANPLSVAVDGAGNLFIADTYNGRVRRVSPSGTITTVAGNGGILGSTGDGGPATNAQLPFPTGVVVDGVGNLFIVDSYRYVRRVSTNGIITTVAGNGQEGYSGDGGPATSAQMDAWNVAVDGAGNLFIADSYNFRVRRVSTNGIITTVAGTGQQGYSGDGGPATSAQVSFAEGLAVDGAGNLFIAGNNRVRRVSPNGIITTVAGGGSLGGSLGDGGPAISAFLADPRGVAVDGNGNLFIAAGSSALVRRVSPSGVITTVAGNGQEPGYSGDGGPATSAPLALAGALSTVAVDGAGNLYIADNGNNRVRRVSPSGIITTVAGNGQSGYFGDGGQAISAQLSAPYSVAVDGTGNLFIADYSNNRVRRVSPNGIITTVAGNGQSGYSGDGGPATSAQLDHPYGVAVDAAGNLFIADKNNSLVRRVSPNGIITTVAGNGQSGYSGDGGPASSAQLGSPVGLAVDGAGNLFVADHGNYVVRKISASGIITTVAGMGGQPGVYGDGGPATSAQLLDPYGVALDAAGNLFIADRYRVRKVSSGVITTIAGSFNPLFSYPEEDGSYYGDGGPATNASFFALGVAVDAAGKIYVADGLNGAIRLLTPTTAAPPPTINSNGVVDAAGYRASVAPGGIASAFGAALASGTANSAVLPLPLTLAGASLALGGKSAPLFFASPGQINFQIPWELAGLTQSSMVATASSVVGNPQPVAMNVVSPGIFTVNSTGSGQGVVTIAATGQTATAATPAPRGQYITIYCSGLGPVSNQPSTGAASPTSPASNTLLIPTVAIGGVQAPVQFSGLTPGLVGLYQINVLVPSTVIPGSAVTLALTINGVSSNSVTIAVQ